MRKSAIKIPTERKCDGVYINCRECRREVKIKI